MAHGDGVMMYGILRYWRPSTGSHFRRVCKHPAGQYSGDIASMFSPGDGWIFGDMTCIGEKMAFELNAQFMSEPWPVKV